PTPPALLLRQLAEAPQLACGSAIAPARQAQRASVSADSDAGPAPSITSATTAECRTICPTLIAPLYSHDVRRLSIGLATLVVAHAPATIGSDASTIRQVAVAGQAAPGGGSFEHFSIEWLPVVAPVNDRGQVAFLDRK